MGVVGGQHRAGVGVGDDEGRRGRGGSGGTPVPAPTTNPGCPSADPPMTSSAAIAVPGAASRHAAIAVRVATRRGCEAMTGKD